MNFILLSVFVLALSLDKTRAGGFLECDVDDNCPATATCENYLCVCPKGEIVGNDGTSCLKLATKIFDKCEIDEQCASIRGELECRTGTCQCEAMYVYLKGVCMKRLGNQSPCTGVDDCFDGLDYNSRSCQDNKCQCNPGYYPRGEFNCRKVSGIGEPCTVPSDCHEGQCVKQKCQATEKDVATISKVDINSNAELDNNIDEEQAEGLALGDPCTQNDTCAVENSHCSPIFGTCSCHKGFFVKSTKCHKELGMPCSDKSECPGAGTVCESDVCNCASLFHYHDTNTKCREAPVLQDGELTCHSNHSCKLLLNNFYCEGKSITEKICKCERGYRINEDYICEISCSSDEDCTFPQNSVCTEQNKCECPPNSKLIGEKCVPRATGKCGVTKDCEELAPNSHCREGHCECNQGYISHAYSCYKIVSVDDECDIHDQCTIKWNSTCSEKRKRCECVEGFVNVNGNCLKMATKVGDYCTSPFVCMEEAICERSKCACPKGMKITPNATGCYVPNPNHGNTITHGFYNIFLFVVITIIMKSL